MSTTDPTVQCREIEELDPLFKKKVKEFLKEVTQLGVFITETYRSQERQEYLYEQGRTRTGNIVTWTLTSNHTGRKAIDIAFKDDKTTPEIEAELYPSKMERWRKVAKKANKYGIDWAYDLWGGDLPHFQDNNNPLPYTPMISKYQEVFDKEVKEPIFNIHEGDEPITEKEVKHLMDIILARFAKKHNL